MQRNFTRNYVQALTSAFVLCVVAFIVRGCVSASLTDGFSGEPTADFNATPAAAVAGDVLLTGGVTILSNNSMTTKYSSAASAELFKQATKTFVATDAMTTSRGGIQAVGFAGNGALAHAAIIPGGLNGGGNLNHTNGVGTLTATSKATSEIYKRATSTFVNGGSMHGARHFYSATLLSNGTILVAGGFNKETPLATAELYNPATGKFAAVGPMKVARAMHTATLLPNGQVLIAGGIVDAHGTVGASAELYNPATGKFTKLAAVMPSPMAAHTATLISGCGCAADGQVLLAGGFSGSGTSTFPASENPLSVTQLYNPASQTFALKASLKEARTMHTATLLPGGKVLFTGGAFGTIQFGNNNITAFAGAIARRTAEIYSPGTNTMACVGGSSGAACKASMKLTRFVHTATKIPSGPLAGQVLLAGGSYPATNGELYNPATNNFVLVGKMSATRGLHAAIVVK
ncbi:MAG TPA: kelch repeat-containing protein [Pseudolabrys sp.]|nr:kelch repeat-containing protein [Pseudolabrys sp.]